MPKNMLSVAAKNSGMVTPRDVVSIAMVTAFRNITSRMAILKALVYMISRSTMTLYNFYTKLIAYWLHSQHFSLTDTSLLTNA